MERPHRKPNLFSLKQHVTSRKSTLQKTLLQYFSTLYSLSNDSDFFSLLDRITGSFPYGNDLLTKNKSGTTMLSNIFINKKVETLPMIFLKIFDFVRMVKIFYKFYLNKSKLFSTDVLVVSSFCHYDQAWLISYGSNSRYLESHFAEPCELV